MMRAALQARPAGWHGRFASAGVVGAYFILLFARGGHRSWGRLGVWALSPPFLDMHSITSAWECTRRGLSVLPVNPCDPLKRPANYPTIWLLPSHLGLGQSSSIALGVVTALVFFAAALMVIPRGSGARSGLVYGLALCSPSVMLGVERGNVDLLVFALMVLAVVLLRRAHGAVASPALLLFATILKLFPIVAAPVLLRLRGRVGFAAFAATITGFAAYALATLGTIREIQRVVPQTAAYSYGIKPFGAWVSNVFATYRIHLGASAWDWLVVGATVAVAAAMQPRLRAPLREAVDADSRDLDCFVVGALIFVTTFSLFESFEYRLVFLLLTLPQLLRWTRARRILGFAGLVSVLLTLWLGAPWFGVPVVHSLIGRWTWLTSRRPLFGADQPLAAAVGAQVILAVILAVLLVGAAAPRVALSRSQAAGEPAETPLPERGPAIV